MKIELKKWEVERIKDIVTEVLSLRQYDFIEASNEDGASLSMSKKTFFEKLEDELNNPHR